jgi:hypothetical protein
MAQSLHDLLKMEQSPSLCDLEWARTITETLRDLIDLHGLSEITNGSFKGLPVYELDLSGLPDLEIISLDCFKDLFQLRELHLSPRLKEIQSGSFTGCTSLTRLDLSNCAELRTFGAEIFKNCWSLREIIFPENSKISEIGAGSFSNCTSLMRLDLSNCRELHEINTDTFKNACSLREIIFGPNITEINSGAFENCTSLTRLRFPASVRKISGRGTFSGCTQLEEVIFEGNTEVDPNAFLNCPRLEKSIFLRKRLPGFRYGKYSELKASLVESQRESGTCGISLEDFLEDSDIVVLPCGHAYFEEAFHQWILIREICPTCKVALCKN